MNSTIRVAAVGDRYVSAELLVSALRNHLPGEMALDARTLNFDWPDTPLQSGEEVSEFVGDPVQIGAMTADAEVLLVHVAPVTRRVMEQAQRLRIVGVSRGGALNINVQAATERGIPVVNAPGRNAQAAVEYTLGMMLAECRGIARAHTVLREGVWEGKLTRYELAGRELQGQTIGLVGFGAIAQALVPYLQPFGVKLLAYDPYVEADRLAKLGVSGVDLDTLLRESDVVSIHARVTPQTRGLIGARELALMKPTARLINTARGPLLDYDALYEALRDGRIGGAALDTFAEEPPPVDWPLLRLPNVTLTPHLAGNTRESAERGAQMVAEDVANFLAGAPLRNCMNRRDLGIA